MIVSIKFDSVLKVFRTEFSLALTWHWSREQAKKIVKYKLQTSHFVLPFDAVYVRRTCYWIIHKLQFMSEVVHGGIMYWLAWCTCSRKEQMFSWTDWNEGVLVDTKAGLTQVLCKQNDLVCVDVIIITFLWTNQRNVHVGLACFLWLMVMNYRLM